MRYLLMIKSVFLGAAFGFSGAVFGQSYVAEGAKISCFPVKLQNQLNYISDFFGGRRVIVVSGHRTKEHQQRVNPKVTNSKHMHCKAADIRVEGVALKDVAALIATMSGGRGYYCNHNFVHIDVAETRSWGQKCGPSKSEVAAMESRVKKFKSSTRYAWHQFLRKETEEIEPVVIRPRADYMKHFVVVEEPDFRRMVASARPYITFGSSDKISSRDQARKTAEARQRWMERLKENSKASN